MLSPKTRLNKLSTPHGTLGTEAPLVEQDIDPLTFQLHTVH